MEIDIKKIKSRQQQTKKTKKKKDSSIIDFFNRDIKLFGRKLNDKRKKSFYEELYILLSSGIDIRTSLNIIVEKQNKTSDKELFSKVYDNVVKGDSFSEALWKTGNFSTYEYYSLKIGEESGRLHEILNEITSFFAKRIKQRRQLTGALTYPIIVLITAFVAVFFMMNFIVPMFIDVFKRFGGELPTITKFIMRASESFNKFVGPFTLILIVVIVFLSSIRNKIWYRKISSTLLIKLPIFGKIVKKVYLARYCHSMGLLIGSKTPMIQTLQLVRKMIKFYPYEKALEKTEQDIMNGKTLFESMEQFSFFDQEVTSLVKVGENVNQLDHIFQQLNHKYSEELEHQFNTLSSTLEPILIIFVGALVAVILIAMYLPLFQLSTSIY